MSLDPPPHPLTPSSTRPDQPEQARPWVLLVDDDAEMRAYMHRCLAPLPLRVTEAADGAEALACTADGLSEVPVLIITDIVMPRMDGLSLKKALQADARLCDVPVLLITGEVHKGGDGPMLRKPFNARRLRAAVRALL